MCDSSTWYEVWVCYCCCCCSSSTCFPRNIDVFLCDCVYYDHNLLLSSLFLVVLPNNHLQSYQSGMCNTFSIHLGCSFSIWLGLASDGNVDCQLKEDTIFCCDACEVWGVEESSFEPTILFSRWNRMWFCVFQLVIIESITWNQYEPIRRSTAMKENDTRRRTARMAILKAFNVRNRSWSHLSPVIILIESALNREMEIIPHRNEFLWICCVFGW